MYGWRGRIGLIIPSSNTTMESEFWRMVPEGVSVHTTRLKLLRVTVNELKEMAKNALHAAQLLATANVDVIVYGCTSGALIGGIEWEENLRKSIEKHVKIPTITTAFAVVNALRELGVRKISVATPYIDEVNVLEKKFLESNGFKVIKIKGLGIADNIEIGKQPPWTTYRLVREVNSSEAEAIFISCTNFRTIEVISKLEEDLGKPVISSNTASLWASLKILGVKQRVEGYGKLLETRL